MENAMRKHAVASTTAILLAITCHADTSLYLEKGELVLDEAFDGDSFDVAKWPATRHARNATGIKVDGGFFVYDSGKSADKLKRINLHHHFSEPVGDLVLQFQFSPGPGFNWLNIAFNDEDGHCFVTKLATDKIYSYKYKEKNTRSFPEYVDLSGSKLSAESDYLITVEISDGNVFVHVDDEHFLLGNHTRFRNPKTSAFLGVQGGTGKIDWIKIWTGKRIENPDIASWEARKAKRPKANLDLDPRFKKDKQAADARVALKNNETYRQLLQATMDHESRIKDAYPFFKSLRPKDKVKHKDALKTNTDYTGLLKQLRNLEKTELEYLHKRFSGPQFFERLLDSAIFVKLCRLMQEIDLKSTRRSCRLVTLPELCRSESH
jgi:hypothetical protein